MRPIALSIGCPAGIGAEVAVKAALASDVAALIVGDPELVGAVAKQLGAARRVRLIEDAAAVRAGEIAVWAPSVRLARPVRPGKPNRAAGAAQLAWIDQACDLVAVGRCSALVTAPVSKEAIASSGAPGAASFRGHTEHLAERLRAREVVMAFALGSFATSLATTHLPLRAVPRALGRENVARACYWLARLLIDLGGKSLRIAVAGLNPHAGEGGLLGSEEKEVIAPGMLSARRRLARERLRAELIGPIGAESAYRLAASAEYQGVVAMYHDQATIACKLMGFGEAVNVTLGLPIIRTSVDHGTAYDLAGKYTADESGMRAALDLAARLV